MNLYCIGKLDAANTCLLCLTKFCIKCDRAIPQNTSHTCKPEDLESIDFIKSLIKCPECKVPVQRSDGCDSITCSNCQTRFNYITGERGGHGSHNAQIIIKQRRKLSDDLKGLLGIDEYKVLLNIESKEPPLKTDKSLVNSVKMYYEIKDKLEENQEIDLETITSIGLKIARGLEFLVTNQIHTKKFYNALAEIEYLNKNNQLTLQKLKQINSNLKS
jgi:LSD1 subclass zinc finger protein